MLLEENRLFQIYQIITSLQTSEKNYEYKLNRSFFNLIFQLQKVLSE